MPTCSSFLRSAIAVSVWSFAAAPVFAADEPAAPAAEGDGLAGAYLAARLATEDANAAAAAPYYDRLLLSNPANRAFQEGALVSHVSMGDLDRASAIADVMLTEKDPSQLAALIGLAADARSGDFAKGLALLDSGADAGDLISGVYRAWALAGTGRMSDAGKAFDALARNPALAGVAEYHKALALAMVGDYEGAEAIFAGPQAKLLATSRRTVLAHAQVLSRLERDPDAVALIDRVFGARLDPELADLRARLEKGEMLPFTIAPTAKDGVAEIYLAAAQAIAADDQTSPIALMHARLALWLRPDLGDAAMVAASILAQQKQYDAAIAVYADVAEDSALYPAALLGRADALAAAGQPDGAIETLEQLTQAKPDLQAGWLTLGDALRRENHYQEAKAAYDKAIALIKTPDAGDWFAYFARGISEDKLNDWPAAEADLREALKLSPGQPSALNYLGYSYVEQKQNLDEALDMIRRAVAARPEEGYIVDSLGWALFRLGRYDEAVTAMEKAVQLDPTEPLLNDHLGDVYWAAGHRQQAEFQWRRALNLPENPDDDLDRDRVRRKLDLGLDEVLKQEGAAPLTAAAAPPAPQPAPQPAPAPRPAAKP